FSQSGRSLDPGAFAVDAVLADPAIDPAPVVPDLEALSLNRLHQMQVVPAVHLAQHDVAYLQGGRDHRLDRTQLPGLDLAPHRIPPGPELNGFPVLEADDVIRSPSHLCSFQRSSPNSLASRNWPSLRKCLRRNPSSRKPHFTKTRADAG